MQVTMIGLKALCGEPGSLFLYITIHAPSFLLYLDTQVKMWEKHKKYIRLMYLIKHNIYILHKNYKNMKQWLCSVFIWMKQVCMCISQQKPYFLFEDPDLELILLKQFQLQFHDGCLQFNSVQFLQDPKQFQFQIQFLANNSNSNSSFPRFKCYT